MLLPPCFSGWKREQEDGRESRVRKGGERQPGSPHNCVPCQCLPWGWGVPHNPGLIAHRSVLKVSTGMQGTPWKRAEQPSAQAQISPTPDLGGAKGANSTLPYINCRGFAVSAFCSRSLGRTRGSPCPWARGPQVTALVRAGLALQPPADTETSRHPRRVALGVRRVVWGTRSRGFLAVVDLLGVRDYTRTHTHRHPRPCLPLTKNKKWE